MLGETVIFYFNSTGEDIVENSTTWLVNGSRVETPHDGIVIDSYNNAAALEINITKEHNGTTIQCQTQLLGIEDQQSSDITRLLVQSKCS